MDLFWCLHELSSIGGVAGLKVPCEFELSSGLIKGLDRNRSYCHRSNVVCAAVVLHVQKLFACKSDTRDDFSSTMDQYIYCDKLFQMKIPPKKLA